MFTGIDKVLHVTIFAMLGFCFAAAFPRTRLITFTYIMLSYAFLTEILQDAMGFGRSSEIFDIVADTAGMFLGMFIYKAATKRYF